MPKFFLHEELYALLYKMGILVYGLSLFSTIVNQMSDDKLLVNTRYSFKEITMIASWKQTLLTWLSRNIK